MFYLGAHEKEFIPHGPDGCPVAEDRAVGAPAEARRPAGEVRAARDRQRHLLRHANRLPVAGFAARLAAVSDCVSLLPFVAAHAASTRGKKIVGRKRHLVVDTLGLIWALAITPADVQDRDGGKLVLKLFRAVVKFPKIIWADQAYKAVVAWAWIKWVWDVSIVTRPRGRFVLQAKRWIVERTFGWLNRSRRLAKSFERTPESDAAFVQVAMIQLMIKRIA